MAKLTVKEVTAMAKKVVLDSPGGIRFSELLDKISILSPETPRNTIRGSIWNLDTKFPNEIVKPAKGLFKSADSTDTPILPQRRTIDKPGKTNVNEENFYQPFAEWLQADLDEVKVAVALGGNGLTKKWGTPDVVGVYKKSASDLIDFDLEIVSAEIKTDPQEPVVAFGQAAAYRLFSTKTYVVMPKIMTPENKDRLEALCLLYGMGLVLFEINTDIPNFDIRVRAQRFNPDMFYVNEFARSLNKHNPEKFEELFG